MKISQTTALPVESRGIKKAVERWKQRHAPVECNYIFGNAPDMRHKNPSAYTDCYETIGNWVYHRNLFSKGAFDSFSPRQASAYWQCIKCIKRKTVEKRNFLACQTISTVPNNERLANLCFDGMSVSSSIRNDQHKDEISGFEQPSHQEFDDHEWSSKRSRSLVHTFTRSQPVHVSSCGEWGCRFRFERCETRLETTHRVLPGPRNAGSEWIYECN